jgi:DHA2 family multidrug resistance protein-like MFS transporter
MLPFMTPVFLQIGMGFSPFHAGLMMIPMVLGSMGMKRIVVQVVNRFGYRHVLVTATLGLALVSLLFMAVALMGWYYVLPLVLFCQGIINSMRFSSMNTLTLKDLPDDLASSGNSLLSMIMQLSMSVGVTIAVAARHVRPAPSQRRHAGGASGLFVYLSQHGGHHRPARVHLRQSAG